MDDKTAMDLCSIESDVDFDKNKSQNEDDENNDEKSKLINLKIPGKIKAYRAILIWLKMDLFGKLQAKKYSKEQIAQMKEDTTKAINEEKKLLEQTLSFKDKQQINKELITAK